MNGTGLNKGVKMEVIGTRLLKCRLPDVIETNKKGEDKIKKRFIKLGVKVFIDNVLVTYNFRTKCFGVKYPDRQLTNRAGGKTGEIEKGQHFRGITHARLLKEFSPKFVELVGNAIVNFYN